MATQRNSRQAVRNGRPTVPGWGLFLIGLVVGVVAMWIAYPRMPSLRRTDQPHANASAVASPATAQGIAAASGSAPSSTSQFDFYKVLPEKEVVIPNAQLSAMAKAEQQQAAAANNPASASTGGAAATAATQGGYVLQLGAFPDAADADAMKAKLALQGFTAHVQAVTLDGKVWNRVRIGPFATAAQLQGVQKQLAGAGIHGVALKEK